MRVVIPPLPIVTIDEAKKHLIVEHTDDDLLIEVLILAATQWIDGPAGWLGRSLGVQTLEIAAENFACGAFRGDTVKLPYGPLIDIVSITYVDPDGADTVFPSDQYRKTADGIWLEPGASWPSIRYQPGGIRVQYRAGYGKFDTAEPPALVNDVPAPIRVAVLMLVAQWYQTRQPVVVGATVETLPFAVEALLSPYRVYF